MMIDGNEGRARHGQSRLRLGLGIALGLLLVAGTVYAGTPRSVEGEGRAGHETVEPTGATVLSALESRVHRVARGWAELDAYYHAEVAPIERALLRYRDDQPLVSRVAAAVVREAKAAELEPRLLLGVLLVENPWLEPTARSFVGAVGLMQVMPVHRGGWSCGYDLEQIDTNICLGARVFAHYLDRTDGDLERALLRYNGCVNGSNTPDCHLYPSQVFARADAASMVASAGHGFSAASP